MSNYYDGTKLLSLMDINGEQPEIYLCTTNRTGGKTTYFGRYVVNKYLRGEGKFCLIYRYTYELDGVADKFFKDLETLFFNGYRMNSKVQNKGAFTELFIARPSSPDNYESCGYAISLNKADAIKKNSHLLSDVERMVFDEFQSETNTYLKDEVSKLISIHTSIARGQGKQYRRVPLFMLSNTVSILNPYYTALGITKRLKSDTKFLRGDGFVLEQGYVESASLAQRQGAFNRAFSGDKYMDYATQNVYLNDNTAFIETPTGKNRYILTIRYQGKDYAIREYIDSGYMYCDDKPDATFRTKIAVTTDDHNVNYSLLQVYGFFIKELRDRFDNGNFRFKDLMCKEAVLTLLSYN